MNIFRIANIIIAIAMISFVFFPELPSEVIITFIPIIFLLFGVEGVKNDDKVLGYFYIIAGLISFPGLIIKLF
ncbi:hypothetical protein J2Z83_003051 [Virgibacillus natechei]|uniref:DUF3953 domain-containing protein n=1 Tax=Virgibacillus natechei TaxID=1216297 RepID=A0ABS4IIX2_9BACI|nr:DUF3953 domain-containing protein [Virgibacillus natechei]MBP1970915.1 hypothetical protein [Virgibacillus natechei]UZD13297.1 DUF3953 domain-containing protein [Virgibacillus natechei]